jgi:hypothetical protein
MSFFSLKNLVSKEVFRTEAPWKFSGSVPEQVKGKAGKKLRDKWINDPATQHEVYSSFEGFVDNMRVASPKNEEGNPPLRMHAFIADIDAPLSTEEIEKGIGRIPFAPNHFERTLSGNVRLIWLLEKPVSFPNRRFAIEFLEMALERMKLLMLAVGLDRGAFLDPNRYYTNSGEWLVGDENTRISAALTDGWVVEVAAKHLWSKDRGAIDIPLPVVQLALEKKYPLFPRVWVGEFVEGATGPTFWVEGSSSPKSAIVKPTGLFTFSAHAIKPFYTWENLLGKAFVETYTSEAMGRAVEGIAFDGSKYWRKDGYGDWKNFSKDDIVSHLVVDRGLENKKGEGDSSETTRAIQYIHNWQGVTGSAPFVFQPSGILTKQGNKFLNTHTRRVCQPSEGKVVWGPTGQMPFLSAFFDGLFHADSSSALQGKPIDYFFSWLKRFYVGGYTSNLESGQNVFLCGGPGIGKTFLNQGLIPYLMGGGADAESYLLGSSDFNSQLFEVALWTIDDNSATVTDATHRKFSTMIKKMAANTTFQYHAKFRVPCMVEWMGRCFVTLNADEASTSIIPDLAISIMDKIMIFRSADVAPVTFPSRTECHKLIQNETPYLARFLLDYEVPEYCKGSSRFGVVSYHDAALTKTAEQSSSTSSFVEILDDWRSLYFSEHSDLKFWEGSAYQFLKELHKDTAGSAAGLRNYTPKRMAIELAAVRAKGIANVVPVDGDGLVRNWRIYKSAPPKHEPLPTSTSSQFQK